MKVFIVDKKRFNGLILRNKNIEFIVCFDKDLYEKLQKYNIVLIDKKGKIRKSNYFPDEIYNLKSVNQLISFKKNIFRYFEKQYLYLYRSRIGDIRRTNMLLNPWIALVNKKKIIQEKIEVLDNAIFEILMKYFEVKYSKEYVEKHRYYFEIILNYITSFYRAYVYSLSDLKRGAELFNDIFRFIDFYELLKNHRPSESDLTKSGLKRDYIKVVSRFFIERIHKNSDIREFAKKNIELWRENKWIE